MCYVLLYSVCSKYKAYSESHFSEVLTKQANRKNYYKQKICIVVCYLVTRHTGVRSGQILFEYWI
jgi:hypothetical protein